MTHASIQNDAIPQRRWDIDWLRVLTVLMLVPFHSARIFNQEDWYVKSNPLSSGLDYCFIYLFSAFGMQLLFLLAGASTWYALRRRSPRPYARERFSKLLIPFIFGLIVIVPIQSYLGMLHHTDYDSSFIDYLIGSESEFRPDSPEGFQGGISAAHLWFIMFLFVLALVALPLFAYLRRESGRRWIDKLAESLARPGAILLLAIPPIAAKLLLGSDFDFNPLYYLVFFVYGYIMVADTRFEQVIDRYKKAALLLWLLLYLLWLWLDFGLDDAPAWLEALVDPLHIFVTCCSLIAILGYGKKYLKFTGGRFYLVRAAPPQPQAICQGAF